ncbi:hypothetical protein [Anaeromyxobacter paludicola]|uniref:Small CPxCG-related zinc finger protein n=1 Tax=Anaeromyxobacter paludicola TaxID=2918171 RepID=A0ABM7XA15_9BACT|nr:hypothetical protein [Anaeromyxobacter paludicola]BDG08678.1 hypothetical protein AMPC_17910 [Anaeromyxobacter paludicola]
MREPTKDSPADRGEVMLRGQCQVCGAEGPIVAVPLADPPNQFCPRCAIEYGESAGGIEEELRP